MSTTGAARRRLGPRGFITEAPPRPISAALVRLGLRVTGLLPLRAAHGIGAVAGSLLAFVPTRERHVTAVNLALTMPQLSTRERARLCRRSLAHLGRMAAELGILWTRDPSRVLALVKSVEGRAIIDEALAAGRGVFVVTPHLGSWEMLLLHLGASHGIATLYRPQRIEELDDFVRRARERTGGRLLPPSSAVREVRRALAKGAICGMASDQDPGEGSGIFVPFMGQLANTRTLPGRLVAATGALLVIGVAERLPRGAGFAVRFERASQEAHAEEPEIAARALNADVERIIRRLPEQYLWSYKRYRIRADGGPDPYRRGEPQRGDA
jgi:KDO2-lipid IV(A) lauroyltransferase